MGVINYDSGMAGKKLVEQAEILLTGMGALEAQLADPGLYNDRDKAIRVRREHAWMLKIQEEVQGLRRIADETRQAEEVAGGGGELAEMAEEELAGLREAASTGERSLRLLLLPRDPADEKNCIIEIRAGTGGDEASLFAADLLRMYQRYVERMGWRGEIMAGSITDVGGFRETIYSVAASQAYAHLKYESGVHRVQRIPTTESSGRLHTSAVTVAVLPEAEETDIDIRNEDLRIDVYRSSGPGGQSVNTTDSAVRITHVPTGVVVICQDEKSQHKNRAKAMRVLRARLYQEEERRLHAERDSERRSMVGSGDRSQRVRTYNFPQNRVTDHRINLTLHKLDAILDGDIQELIDNLRLSDEEGMSAAITGGGGGETGASSGDDAKSGGE